MDIPSGTYDEAKEERTSGHYNYHENSIPVPGAYKISLLSFCLTKLCNCYSDLISWISTGVGEKASARFGEFWETRNLVSRLFSRI